MPAGVLLSSICKHTGCGLCLCVFIGRLGGNNVVLVGFAEFRISKSESMPK